MRFISDKQATQALDLALLTDRLEDAFADLAAGRAASTARVRASAGDAMASALAAAWPGGGVTGGKLYATRQGVFTFLTALFDMDGQARGIIEGDGLTRARTAATTAIALRHLCPRPPTVVTVIGTGRQCPGHLAMLAREVEQLREVRIVGRRDEPLGAAVATARALGLPADGSTDPATAVGGADVIITLTSSTRPLFEASAVTGPAVIAAIGATKADRAEIDAEIVGRASRVVTDDPIGVRTECGDLIAAAEAGLLEWEQVESLASVVGAQRTPSAVIAPPVSSEAEIILYESQGTALQDIVAGALVLEHFADMM